MGACVAFGCTNRVNKKFLAFHFTGMNDQKEITMDTDPENLKKDLKCETTEIKDLSQGENTQNDETIKQSEAPNGDFNSRTDHVVDINNLEESDENIPEDKPDEIADINPPTLDSTEDDEDKWNDNYTFVEDDKPGIDPDEKDPKKLILWAAQKNELETLRDLLEKDPTLVNVRDSDQYTPLHRAAYSNNVEVIKILLSYDADISAKTIDGWTPLHSACKWDSVEAVSLLIQNGANVNAQTNGHVTPLHLAAANAGGRRTLELLLWHPHIDPNIKNDAHDTPYDIVCRSGPLGSLFEMLEESVNVY